MTLKHMIERERLVSLLTDLISIRSVNPAYDPQSNEREIADYIAARLGEWQIPYELQEVEPGRCNLIARWKGTDPSKCLLFEAHMDTAAVEGMRIDPFHPMVKNGRTYGRGACDTKAGLAAMLYALKIVKACDLRPAATILLAATMDEEYSFRGVSHLVESGVRANGAVVSEPTDLEVIIAHKGCLRWRIVTRGEAAHSSKVHLGTNAIVKMVAVIQAIEAKIVPAYEQRTHPLLGNPTLNIGLIKGGVQVNTIPEHCVIEIDRRLLPGEDRQAVWNEFSLVLEELQRKDPELDVSMEPPMLEDYPLETSKQERIVFVAEQACRKVRGDSRLMGVPYGTNASKLGRAGIPSIVLGPGSIDQAHSAVEYVSIDQLTDAVKIYLQIMLDF